MEKEDKSIYNCPQEGWSSVIFRKIEVSWDHYFEQNKPDWEKQVSHILFNMWNLEKMIKIRGKTLLDKR